MNKSWEPGKLLVVLFVCIYSVQAESESVVGIMSNPEVVVRQNYSRK